MTEHQDHIKWFRDSSPYINAHRGKTFVLALTGDALASANLGNVISDIALLNSLGVRLILVHGLNPSTASPGKSDAGDMIVPSSELTSCIETTSGVRADIEARLSLGLVNSPMHGADIVVTSGNFVRAKPIGIIDGMDHQHGGKVRKVNVNAVSQQLDNGAVVLQSPMGYSLTGETFILNDLALAAEIAIAVRAEKLIIFSSELIRDGDGGVISEIQTDSIDTADHRQVALKRACERGVDRGHIVSCDDDGAVLGELFTRDGTGNQITRTSYEQVRRATPEDIAGIIALIAPLEDEGILVRRSRELLESEVDHFTVIERDGMIVSCAALYPFSGMGELACLATHPDYRDDERGEVLLAQIERQANSMGLSDLFVLTTQTRHWFVERGFEPADLSSLPDARKSAYNYQRNSSLLTKSLQRG